LIKLTGNKNTVNKPQNKEKDVSLLLREERTIKVSVLLRQGATWTVKKLKRGLEVYLEHDTSVP